MKNWSGKPFKTKSCKYCKKEYEPQSPSHLYCSQECAALGIVENRYQRIYKMSVKEFERMLEKQNYLCAICKTEGFKMHKGIYHALVVDHDHETGEVRGALCNNCNRGLGLFQDDVQTLKNAIQYLEGATTIPKGSTSKRVEARDTLIE